MTLAIRQHTENGIYVVMEARGNLLVIEACQCQENNRCGYPVATSQVYSINEKNKADATFRRYVKKYCKGE